ncbi:MAG TPA: hypothetical protein VHB21_02005 [Minicystis sp.]|nr:hypothetical protein [Minicystis sp.]
MRRWEAETVRDVPKPVVLTVGCSHQLNARCHAAASASGAIVLEAPDPAVAATFVRDTAPLAIVTTDALFVAHAALVEELARIVDADVVTVARDDIAVPALESQILRALVEAARRRGATKTPRGAP